MTLNTARLVVSNASDGRRYANRCSKLPPIKQLSACCARCCEESRVKHTKLDIHTFVLCQYRSVVDEGLFGGKWEVEIGRSHANTSRRR